MAAELLVRFLGDAKDLNKKAEEAHSKISKMFGGGLTAGVAGVFAAAGGAAVGFGAIAVKAALDGEKAHAQLVNAVKNSGHAFSAVGPFVDEASKKLANFGFENDEVETSVANLTRATKNPVAAVKEMGLAADIARGRNISLADATNILIKVQTGHVGLLGKLGINTKDLHGKTISQAEALKRLSAMYGGAAKANAETYAGKMEVLHAKLKNAEEEIGNKLIPVLAGLASFLTDKVIPAIEATVKWVEEHWPEISKTIGDTLSKIRGYVEEFVHIVQNIWDRFGSTILHYVEATWSHIYTVISGALEVIRGIVQVFTALIHGDWGKAWDGVVEIVKGVWKILVGIVRQLFTDIRTVVALAWEGIYSILTWGPVIDAFRSAGVVLANIAINIANAILFPFREAFNMIADVWNATIGGFHFPGFLGFGAFTVPTMGHWSAFGLIGGSTTPIAGGAAGGGGGNVHRYDLGGIVPGPRGLAQLAIVHGGETILPTHRGAAAGSVHVHATIVASGYDTGSQLVRKWCDAVRTSGGKRMILDALDLTP
jgi:hypothetical protein